MANTLVDNMSPEAFDQLKMLIAANQQGAITNNDFNDMSMQLVFGNTRQAAEDAKKARALEDYNMYGTFGDTIGQKESAFGALSPEKQAQIKALKQRAPSSSEKNLAQVKYQLMNPLGIFNPVEYLKNVGAARSDPYGSQGVQLGDNGELTLDNVFRNLLSSPSQQQQNAQDLAERYRTDAGSGYWYPSSAPVDAQPVNNGL